MAIRASLILYEPEVVDNGIYVQLDVMLATQALGLKRVNSYSATSPEAFTPYWWEPNAENRRYWLNTEGVDTELPVVVKQHDYIFSTKPHFFKLLSCF